MTIRIVTDSVSDIPPEIAEAYNITVIPAYVNIGGQSYLDGIELTRQQFYEDLPHYSEPPSTAAPAPGAFAEAYEQLASEGATRILSIHISSALSGILNAARLGASVADKVPVELIDSQQLTMGLGLQVIAAAERVAAGQTLEEILKYLRNIVKRTYVIGLLDTLEYLHRGGRLNWATYGIGTVLRIKPLLQVYQGEVQMVERVRTSKRALNRFLEMASELAPLEHIAILHTHVNQVRLQEFIEKTQHLIPEGKQPVVAELTPTLGAHLGPDGLGIACITEVE